MWIKPVGFCGSAPRFVLQVTKRSHLWTASFLDGIFRVFPNGSILQFLLYADEVIDPVLKAHEQEKIRADDIVQETTQAAVRFFRAGTKGLDKLSGIPVRNFRLFVAAKFPAALKGINLGETHGMTEEILRGAKLHPKALEPEDFLDWMRRFFNGHASLNNHLYDGEIPLRKQIILSESDIHAKSMSRLRIGKRIFACTTPKIYPKEVDFVQSNQLAGGIWGIMSDSDQIRTPFLHSLNIVFHEMKGKMHTKCNAIIQQKGFGALVCWFIQKAVCSLFFCSFVGFFLHCTHSSCSPNLSATCQP